MNLELKSSNEVLLQLKESEGMIIYNLSYVDIYFLILLFIVASVSVVCRW